MQSPYFRNTHGVHNDPQDAHPSKFVLLQPPSPLFSSPLSLCRRFSVSPLLPLSLSPLLSLPTAIGGGLYFFFVERTVEFFRRQTLRSGTMSKRYIPDQYISVLQPLHELFNGARDVSVGTGGGVGERRGWDGGQSMRVSVRGTHPDWCMFARLKHKKT